jgi:hypothetical protein
MFWPEGEGRMKMRPASDVRTASTWRIEEGRLTIYHLGEKISLGRLPTRERAAGAATVSFKEDGGQR